MNTGHGSEHPQFNPAKQNTSKTYKDSGGIVNCPRGGSVFIEGKSGCINCDSKVKIVLPGSNGEELEGVICNELKPETQEIAARMQILRENIKKIG